VVWGIAWYGVLGGIVSVGAGAPAAGLLAGDRVDRSNP
jgi:hypothetical protein